MISNAGDKVIRPLSWSCDSFWKMQKFASILIHRYSFPWFNVLTLICITLFIDFVSFLKLRFWENLNIACRTGVRRSTNRGESEASAKRESCTRRSREERGTLYFFALLLSHSLPFGLCSPKIRKNTTLVLQVIQNIEKCVIFGNIYDVTKGIWVDMFQKVGLNRNSSAAFSSVLKEVLRSYPISAYAVYTPSGSVRSYAAQALSMKHTSNTLWHRII